MRVIVPFTTIEPGVLEAIVDSGYEPEEWFVGVNDTAYWTLLDTLWAEAEDFVIVEQDIVVRPDTLKSFEDCDSHWCAAGYAYLGSPEYVGLGCTRFRRELLETYPAIMDHVARFDHPGHGLRHWCTLDAAMQIHFRGMGMQACRHPTVGHLHDWPSHGCVPRPE